MSNVVRLAATSYEKVWGSVKTEPWLQNPTNLKIGEVWFTPPEGVRLLLKLLFTSEKLSVQVHPNDEQARRFGFQRGKTEMWHILRAEPGAAIALGLRETLTPDRLRQTALSGEIEQYLNWIPVTPGQTYFVPAGTIHAIGAGIVLCEVQQLSDVTWRLYDYGRPRELHLDEGVAVSFLAPQGEEAVPLPVQCQYFRTDCFQVNGTLQIAALTQTTIYVALEGEGTIGGQPFRAGDAFGVSDRAFEINSESARFLTAFEP